MENLRPDFTDALVHLTRENHDSSALGVLQTILSDGIIKGGHGYIKGPHRAVCFSEIPLSSVKYFVKPWSEDARYCSYGICISKKAAYKCGARPVIYLPDSEGGWIPAEEKWRHVRFVYGKMDFTFEREWRKKGDLDLSDVPGFYVIHYHPGETERLREAIRDDLKAVVRGYLPILQLIQML